MNELNTSRIIYFIGGLIVLSLLITGIVDHWEEIKNLIDIFFSRKIITM